MRHGIQALCNRFPLGAFAILGVLAGFAFAGGQHAKPAERAAPARETLRYGGKPFTYWRDSWRTELKAEPRMEALQALAAFGQNGYAKEATAVILEVLRGYDAEHLAFASASEESTDPDQKVVQKADWALDKIGEAAAPVLVNGLHDPHKPLRQYVFERLLTSWYISQIPQSIVPALLRATEQGDRQAAGLAAALLLEGDGPDCALGVVLRSPEQTKALVAALARLLTFDSSEPNSARRVTTAALLLADIGPAARTAIPALKKAWRTPSSSEFCRAGLALALATMKAEPAAMLPEFRAALNDKDEWVRAAAARTLGMFGPAARSALPALRQALEDRAACVRLAAMLSLATIENSPRCTLDDFVAASRTVDDAVSLAESLDRIADTKERLSKPWLEFLTFERGSPLEFVLAHARLAPALRQGLPVIKEAVRILKPMISPVPLPAPQELGPAEGAGSPNADVAAAIAAALKKMPLEPAPASKR